jgi:hemerythrin
MPGHAIASLHKRHSQQQQETFPSRSMTSLLEFIFSAMVNHAQRRQKNSFLAALDFPTTSEHRAAFPLLLERMKTFASVLKLIKMKNRQRYKLVQAF